MAAMHPNDVTNRELSAHLRRQDDRLYKLEERMNAIWRVLVWIGSMLTIAVGTAIAAAVLRVLLK